MSADAGADADADADAQGLWWAVGGRGEAISPESGRRGCMEIRCGAVAVQRYARCRESYLKKC